SRYTVGSTHGRQTAGERREPMKRICAALALACAGISAQARVLWDNNVVPIGSGTRAISPPGFPNIRVADDIRVSGPGWLVDTVRIFVIEDAAWRSGPDD
ncbi:MAG: hypothetical protein AB1725_04955, partial [Armatimonadota bacterium]